MEKIDGLVQLSQTSDTGNYSHDYNLQIGYESVNEIFQKYEGSRIKVTIEEISKDAVCSICGENFYSDQLKQCCKCGELICYECRIRDGYNFICKPCEDKELLNKMYGRGFTKENSNIDNWLTDTDKAIIKARKCYKTTIELHVIQYDIKHFFDNIIEFDSEQQTKLFHMMLKERILRNELNSYYGRNK